VSATVFFSSANELATLSNTFAVDGTATDPTAVTLTVTSPSSVVTSYTWPTPATLTRTGPGAFTTDKVSDESGTWTGRWDGTGSASDTALVTWDVQETALGRLYATVEALKSRMRITGTNDDYELHTACFSASRAVEQECERHFWRTTAAEVRTFEPCGTYVVNMTEFNDLVSIATLKTDSSGDGVYDTTWAVSDYQLWPPNPSAAPEPKPHSHVRAVGNQVFPTVFTVGARTNVVEITGVFGWPAVPRTIQQAALLLAQDTFSLKDTKFGVAQFGDLTVSVGTAGRINPMIDPYRRNPRARDGQKMFVR